MRRVEELEGEAVAAEEREQQLRMAMNALKSETDREIEALKRMLSEKDAELEAEKAARTSVEAGAAALHSELSNIKDKLRHISADALRSLNQSGVQAATNLPERGTEELAALADTLQAQIKQATELLAAVAAENKHLRGAGAEQAVELQARIDEVRVLSAHVSSAAEAMNEMQAQLDAAQRAVGDGQKRAVDLEAEVTSLVSERAQLVEQLASASAALKASLADVQRLKRHLAARCAVDDVGGELTVTGSAALEAQLYEANKRSAVATEAARALEHALLLVKAEADAAELDHMRETTEPLLFSGCVEELVMDRSSAFDSIDAGRKTPLPFQAEDAPPIAAVHDSPQRDGVTHSPVKAAASLRVQHALSEARRSALALWRFCGPQNRRVQPLGRLASFGNTAIELSLQLKAALAERTDADRDVAVLEARLSAFRQLAELQAQVNALRMEGDGAEAPRGVMQASLASLKQQRDIAVERLEEVTTALQRVQARAAAQQVDAESGVAILKDTAQATIETLKHQVQVAESKQEISAQQVSDLTAALLSSQQQPKVDAAAVDGSTSASNFETRRSTAKALDITNLPLVNETAIGCTAFAIAAACLYLATQR